MRLLVVAKLRVHTAQNDPSEILTIVAISTRRGDVNPKQGHRRRRPPWPGPGTSAQRWPSRPCGGPRRGSPPPHRGSRKRPWLEVRTPVEVEAMNNFQMMLFLVLFLQTHVRTRPYSRSISFATCTYFSYFAEVRQSRFFLEKCKHHFFEQH